MVPSIGSIRSHNQGHQTESVLSRWCLNRYWGYSFAQFTLTAASHSDSDFSVRMECNLPLCGNEDNSHWSMPPGTTRTHHDSGFINHPASGLFSCAKHLASHHWGCWRIDYPSSLDGNAFLFSQWLWSLKSITDNRVLHRHKHHHCFCLQIIFKHLWSQRQQVSKQSVATHHHRCLPWLAAPCEFMPLPSTKTPLGRPMLKWCWPVWQRSCVLKWEISSTSGGDLRNMTWNWRKQVAIFFQELK